MTIEKENQIEFWRHLYKLVSLSLSVLFGIVGLIFLVLPEQILSFFNAISPYFGLAESPVQGANFFLILAVAYMYLVTMLAFMMYRNPRNSSFPLLLIHGKSASSIISIILFIVQGHFLIYVVNAITDGSIALGVFLLNRKMREGTK